MTLTDRHIAYESNCRQMFVGQTIRAIIYGELKYDLKGEGNKVDPEPNYQTNYPEIDTLDYSLYFKTEDRTIYIFWDNTFVSYGLKSELLDFTETTNDYEQKWDVSGESKWTDFIGQKITGFNILWEETWSSNTEGKGKIYITYPQAFRMEVEPGRTVIISASEFSRNEDNVIYPLMDNILVTTNLDLALQVKMI